MSEPTRRKFPQGHVLIRQGEQGDKAWLIEDGRLDIFVTDNFGTRRLMTTGPGAIVGEMALIDRGPRSATVLTATEVSCVELSRMTFGRLLARCEPLAIYVLESLIAAIRGSRHMAAAPHRTDSGSAIRSSRDFTKFIVRRVFPTGHVFFRAESTGDTAYLIQSGAVQVGAETTAADDKSDGVQGTLLGPARIFGELALFGSGPYRVTAIATEPTVCEIIHQDEFRKALASMPGPLKALAESYVRQLTAPVRKVEPSGTGQTFVRQPVATTTTAARPTAATAPSGVTATSTRDAAPTLSRNVTATAASPVSPASAVPITPQAAVATSGAAPGVSALAGKLCVSCSMPAPPGAPCPACGHIPGTSDPSPALLPPGTWLMGRYRTGKLLGQGGFGATYLSWDDRLQIRVAIKEYFPMHLVTRAQDGVGVVPASPDRRDGLSQGITKFLAEARTLAGLREIREIVGIQDYFEGNGTAYMVMELLQGTTFKSYIADQGGRIDYKQALKILMSVMSSLFSIHEQGLLHRDISPDNIFMSSTDGIKLLDFGAARKTTGEDGGGLTVILKPGYAPPEQYFSSGCQGPWTDIYATAASFYRAVTGKTPVDAIQRMQEDTLRPPSALGISIPPGIERVLMTALAVRYQDRYDNMKALLAAFATARART